jgi:hypothetical protein
MKFVYNYDPGTFAYAGTSIADPDPLMNPVNDEEGIFLLPANATFIKPLDPVENNLVVFRGGHWGYVHIDTPDEEPSDEPAPPTPDQVDIERDRRTDGLFIFAVTPELSVVFQSRPADRENIAGASTAALASIILGTGTAGNLRWADPDNDFAWIAADNSLIPMDAPTMFAFGQATMAHKQRHIFAARAIKDMVPIPDDYASNDAYWPAPGNAPVETPPEE